MPRSIGEFCKIFEFNKRLFFTTAKLALYSMQHLMYQSELLLWELEEAGE